MDSELNTGNDDFRGQMNSFLTHKHPVQDRVTTETEKSYDRRTTTLGCQMTSLITHINQGKQTTDHQLKVAAE